MSVVEWVIGAVVLVGASLWRWRGQLGRLLAGGSAGIPADALADLIRVVLAEIEAKRIESVKADVERVIRERLDPSAVAAPKNPGSENPGPGGENPGPKG